MHPDHKLTTSHVLLLSNLTHPTFRDRRRTVLVPVLCYLELGLIQSIFKVLFLLPIRLLDALSVAYAVLIAAIRLSELRELSSRVMINIICITFGVFKCCTNLK